VLSGSAVLAATLTQVSNYGGSATSKAQMKLEVPSNISRSQALNLITTFEGGSTSPTT
jgi:acetylxylan esterase